MLLLFTLFYKTSYFNEEVNVLSPTLQLVFSGFAIRIIFEAITYNSN
jgi:hypothetical protein